MKNGSAVVGARAAARLNTNPAIDSSGTQPETQTQAPSAVCIYTREKDVPTTLRASVEITMTTWTSTLDRTELSVTNLPRSRDTGCRHHDRTSREGMSLSHTETSLSQTEMSLSHTEMSLNHIEMSLNHTEMSLNHTSMSHTEMSRTGTSQADPHTIPEIQIRRVLHMIPEIQIRRAHMIQEKAKIQMDQTRRVRLTPEIRIRRVLLMIPGMMKIHLRLVLPETRTSLKTTRIQETRSKRLIKKFALMSTHETVVKIL